MRGEHVERIVLCGLLGLASAGAVGCADKEAADPGAILREELVDRVGPPSPTTSRSVRCGSDADGDLHVRAPQGSRVFRPEDATYDAEAEIVLPEEPARARLRGTKSLGFIGDGKLTPSRSHGGPWAVPDGLLPPHRHVEPRHGLRGSRYGYGGYGHRGPIVSAASTWTAPASAPRAAAPAAPGGSWGGGAPGGSWGGAALGGGSPIGPGWR